jgi:O-succinylbenzoic acid--CoA ligase
VLDRRNDLIVSGGENVYPAEVESVLSIHPGVIEAGVTGREDATWGQVPVAFIKAVSPGPDLSAELEEHCRKYLAGYKVPKAFFFVDDLPRNASGKLMRRKLREWLTHTLQQS